MYAHIIYFLWFTVCTKKNVAYTVKWNRFVWKDCVFSHSRVACPLPNFPQHDHFNISVLSDAMCRRLSTTTIRTLLLNSQLLVSVPMRNSVPIGNIVFTTRFFTIEIIYYWIKNIAILKVVNSNVIQSTNRNYFIAKLIAKINKAEENLNKYIVLTNAFGMR